MKGTIEQSGSNKEIVCSYGRSGTNMMINAIRMNFGVRFGMSHGLADSWVTSMRKMIYMVRDPRNVLPSYYRLLKAGVLHFDATKHVIAPLDFHQMLRGKWVAPMKPYEGHHGEIGRVVNHMLKAPAAAWAKHVAGHREMGMFAIKYENLVSDYENTMQKVSEYLERDLPADGVKPVEGPVGPLPGEGSPEGWKDYFSDEDLALLAKQAGEEMKIWGYTLKM